jgi:hypothetical protein
MFQKYFNWILLEYCLYENCKTCDFYGFCNTCENGFYSENELKNCSSSCNNACLNCSNTTGCLFCKESYPNCNEPEPDTNSNKKKLSTIAIVSISVGSALFMGFLAFIFY